MLLQRDVYPESMVRVLVIDDQPIVRAGLRSLFSESSSVRLVAEARDSSHAMRLSRDLKPNVILMDVREPSRDSFDLFDEVRDEKLAIEFVVLTSITEAEWVHHAIRKGATAFLQTTISGAELIEAIVAASAGQTTLSPAASRAMMRDQNRERRAEKVKFTARELEVLQLLTEGLNNKQMAEQLYVTCSTIKFHVSNVLSKLSAKTRTEAVSIALRDNLILPQVL